MANEIELAKYIKLDGSQFIQSRVVERLPLGTSGLIDAQTKVMHTAISERKVYTKNGMKVAALASLTAAKTDSEHGDTNLHGVIKNIVIAPLPLLKGEGTFATRAVSSGGAPRYIVATHQPYIAALFPKLDNTHLLEYRLDENTGEPYEPLSFNPSLPLLLINGQKQIGVGYAVHVLPRDIKKIIQVLKNFTVGKMINSNNWRIPVKIPHYKGIVTFSNSASGRQWLLKGKYELNKLKLTITEYRHDQEADKYSEYLQKLVGNGTIRKFVNESYRNDIRFVVDLYPNAISLDDKSIRSWFLLDSHVTENINSIDRVNGDNKGILSVFKNERTYLQWWYHEHLKVVTKRKVWLTNEMGHELGLLESVIYYIRQIIAEKIEPTKISNQQLRKILEDDSNIIQDIDPNTGEDRGYEYILKLRITQLTTDDVAKREKKIKDVQKELKELHETTVERMYIADIEAVERTMK